jgi:selenocysteine lyase/cysteine desulfurase
MIPRNWDEYRDLFADRNDRIWLNHAGVSPISKPVAEAVAAHAQDVLENGAANVIDWYGQLKKIKRLASKLLNCDPKDLAVTPNTTHGINLVANGLRWEPGDQVILCTKEYPANVYPWWAQQAKGVELVWVEPDEEGRLPVELYEEKITDKTRILTVSHVQFASGYRHDLERLGKICKEAGILFFVDAIQSFSVFPIDIRGWNIDGLTTGSHKWLLGPTGIALFYTTPELRDRMETTYVGADAVVNALDYLDYRFELLADGRRFENAMLNFAGVAGLNAALWVVDSFGRDRIEEGVRQASDRMLDLLQKLGFQNHSSRAEGEWSGILSLSHPKTPPEKIAGALKKDKIITSIRDGRLRVSPHAYHTEEAWKKVEKGFSKALS